MVADALGELRLDDTRETDRLKIILGVDYGTTFTGMCLSGTGFAAVRALGIP